MTKTDIFTTLTEVAKAAAQIKRARNKRRGAKVRVITFQPHFATLVQRGAKTQTMRKKASCEPGDTLSLRQWSGQPYRSKQVLIKEVVCKSVAAVCVDHGSGVKVDGKSVGEEEFAQKDGFKNFCELLVWLDTTHGLPFHGDLISW
jgi:hypothetical protein